MTDPNLAFSAVPVLIEGQATRTPDRTAVRAGIQSLSYLQLDRRANHLAHILAAHGVRRGTRVAVLLPHSLETVVALLGVLKTGAAYVPLDTEYPAARLAQMLDDSTAAVLVTTSDLVPTVPGTCHVVCMDNAPQAGVSDVPLGVEIAPDDPVYVIFSSGSTGRPKGIVIPHRALVNYVQWANAAYLRNSASDLALHTSLAFDLTVTSIFTPLTTGGAVVAYPPRGVRPPILDVMDDDRVDVIKLTPSHLALAVEHRATPARLRAFIVGGENFDVDLARRVDDRFGGRVAIFNEYGPTETTVGCMIHRFDRNHDRRASVPIGRPAADTYIYLLDDQLTPVGNSVGEIFVGGAGLALGYLDDPSLTADRFIADPFRDGHSMYRTGDLARRLADDTLEFVGRQDDQIKIRGHRIHLNEIGDRLVLHPLVRDCIVRRLDESNGRASLVAYYVADAPIEARELRRFAREYLMEAAVPTGFVWLEQLPLNINGKVDVGALPPPEAPRTEPPASDQRPRTETERQLVEIWCRLLRFNQIGIRESFFDLGGDSLLAVQLMLEIERALGVQLSAAALFPEGTIETLAEAIENQKPLGTLSPLVALRPGGDRLPLFFLHGIAGEVLYCEPIIRHLPPEQPVYGLQAAGLNLPGERPLRIEAIASRYVEAVQQLIPDGPYYLVGYSAGGIIAYEMAQQLRSNGHEIGLLGVIDGDAPNALGGGFRWTPQSIGQTLMNAGYWTIDDLLVSSSVDLRVRVRSKARLLRQRVAAAGESPTTSDIRDRLGVPELLEHQIPWLNAYVDAMNNYRPLPYDGRLTLFRARTFGLFQRVVPDRGWGSLAREVKIQVIKGNHATILREPHVRALAQQIEQSLAARTLV